MLQWKGKNLYFRTTDRNFVVYSQHDHGSDLIKLKIKKKMGGYKLTPLLNSEQEKMEDVSVNIEFSENMDLFKIVHNGEYFSCDDDVDIVNRSSVSGDYFSGISYEFSEIDIELLKDADDICEKSPSDIEYYTEKYSNIKKNGFLCIVTAVKDEGIYLPHWIDYHRSIGVEHFFIYTNNNSDLSDSLLLLLNSLNFVTVINNTIDGSNKSPQRRAYTHAFVTDSKYVRSYEWCLAIDVDEYISLSPIYGKNFQKFLRSFPEDVTSVSLCWQFAKPTHVCGPQDLIKPLPERSIKIIDQKYIGDGYRLIKTVFRTESVISTTPHFPFWKEGVKVNARLSDGSLHEYKYNPAPFVNDPIFTDKFCTVRASIVHYFSKSPLEFFIKTCRSRGFDDYVDGVDLSRLNDAAWVNSFMDSLLDEKTAKKPNYGVFQDKGIGDFSFISRTFQKNILEKQEICALRMWKNFESINVYIDEFYKGKNFPDHIQNFLREVNSDVSPKKDNTSETFDKILNIVSSSTDELNAPVLYSAIKKITPIYNKNKKMIDEKISMHPVFNNIFENKYDKYVLFSSFIFFVNQIQDNES